MNYSLHQISFIMTQAGTWLEENNEQQGSVQS